MSFATVELLGKYRELRYYVVSVVSICLALTLFSFPLFAQGNYEVVDEPVRLVESKAALQDKNTLKKQVTLVARDSTVRWVIHEIARQAGLKPIVNELSPGLNSRVSVNISKMYVMDALAVALKGSALEVMIGSDNETLRVRPKLDTLDSEGREKKSVGSIVGRVVDSASGKGVAGATVLVVGTALSAVSNDKGEFQIRDVPVGNHTISVKLLGFKTVGRSVEVVDARGASVDVRMAASATALSEVVTTATGRQRRVEVGHDIVKLNATEILERAPARSVSDMLRYAQVPGVQVMTASGEPGAPSRIRMRGIGSISQNTDPAIIVDGIWVNSKMSDSSIISKVGGGGYGIGNMRYTSSPLDDIDPSIIESIEIVRGPSAASLYGQEAANGVIVITTKRGKAGQTAWNYSFSKDWDSQVRAKFGRWVPYGTNVSGQAMDDCGLSAHYGLVCVQDSVVDIHRFGFLLDETGPASSFRHNISLRGGTADVAYNFSASYQNLTGTRRIVPADLIRLRMLNIPVTENVIKPSGESKVFLTSSVVFTPRRSLNFDISINAINSNSRQNGVQTTGNTGGLRYGMDTLAILDHTSAEAEIFLTGSDGFSIKSALTARYHPDTWWNALAAVGIDRGEREEHRKIEHRLCNLGVCEPYQTAEGLRRGFAKTNVLTGRISSSGAISTRWDNIFSVRPSIGLDVRRTIVDGLTLALDEGPFGADQASGRGRGTIVANDVITAGYYVNTSLKLMNRMFFDLGFRQDAGSVIKINSASRYPKIATSWLVSDEGFFPRNTLISLLRLRGAVGYAAVHPEAADLYGGYRYSTAIINGKQRVIADLSTIGNNKLVPERSLELEGGFDADLLQDRMELIFTMAHKTLRNAIITRSLPTSSGLPANRKENVSRVDNRSVELSINTRLIDNDAMLLQIQTGLSNVNNVIKRLGDKVSPTSNLSRDRLVEGYQIGSVWARPVLGYGDVDNNGYIDNAEVLLGDTTVYQGWNTPKFTASYSGSLALLNRNLSLSFSFSHTGPRVQKLTYSDNYGSVVVGAPVEIQAFSKADDINGGASMRVSEVRLMYTAINYNLPASISNRLKAKLITISLQGSNLGLWTNYTGRDPMVNSTPVGNTISDNGFTLPMPRKYAFNVRLEL